MALPIGKLTIPGIAGSILSQEGKLSDFLSGAAKFVFKHMLQDDARPTRKPQNDSLLAQESKLGRLEGKQDIANHGNCFLVDCASKIEGRRNIEASPASSGPPKLSGITHSPRTLSTPPAVLALEPPSPSPKVLSRTGSRSLQPASPSGLKVLQVMSDQSCPPVMAASHGSQTSEGTSSSSSSSRFGWKLGGFLTRTKSSAT